MDGPRFDLQAPQNDQFLSLEDCLRTIQSTARENGYAIVKSRTKSTKSEVRKVWFICDKGRKYDARGLNDEQRKRPNTGTRQSPCPFKAIAKKNNRIWPRPS